MKNELSQIPEGNFGPTKYNNIGTFEHRGNNTYVIQEKTALVWILKNRKKREKRMSMRNNSLHEEFYASTKSTINQILDYSLVPLDAKHNTTNEEVVNLTSIYK